MVDTMVLDQGFDVRHENLLNHEAAAVT